jgi:hypothetical protein
VAKRKAEYTEGPEAGKSFAKAMVKIMAFSPKREKAEEPVVKPKPPRYKAAE